MNNKEKLSERDDDTKMLGNVSTDELEQMAKTHPRSALTIAYSEGLITGIKRAKAYAQQQSEPVAWRYRNSESGDFCYMTNYPQGCEDACPFDVSPLFTHPPATVQQTEPVAWWHKQYKSTIYKSLDAFAYDHVDISLAEPLYATPPNAVPDGYALVPIEPTEEMEFLGNKVADSLAVRINAEDYLHDQDTAKQVYKAMLSASPTPPNAVPLEKYNKLLEALKFYAEKEHVNFGDNLNKNFPNVFAMKYVPISGGEYPACIENGEFARQAIAEAEVKP